MSAIDFNPEILPDNDMEAMKIKFGGANEIDANTLINSLLHFTNIVHETHKEIAKSFGVQKKVEVKIKATHEGSFLVDWLYRLHQLPERSVHYFLFR